MHVIQQGTVDVVHNQVWYRLVHGRGLHSRTRTSPDLIPSTPPKVNHAALCSILFYYLRIRIHL